ncbi:prenyltransferase/squalene oxidase repeat-containing protein [Pseudanabaena sp. UWO310]|uniref:prenyltransferase/squalene oxidase repeat-containing protein n=1 Tax=Pseudanabaena sp. UWO310 TaxID=2480795 RepID=UPI001161435D|nr:prenyltransferase/squalene oxidase repeat-containing protein [Pseudanabaena sp. UWO310]TYQ23245.1 terpene cyclase/mutase family protein [Pseudanabaena sp. UWO310]
MANLVKLTEEGLNIANRALLTWSSVANFCKIKNQHRGSVTKFFRAEGVSTETFQSIGIELEIAEWKDNWKNFCEIVEPSKKDAREIAPVDCFSTKPSYCQGNGKQNYCAYCSLLFDRIKEFIINDQIESGGWGKSLGINECHEYWYGQKPSPLDLREGSIFGIYQAVRGLLAIGVEITCYEEIGKRLIQFLFTRQKPSGEYARFVVTRGGSEELYGSPRHTAFVVITLAMVNASADRIMKGIKFLSHITLDELKSDKAPSIAIVAFLLVYQTLIQGEWGNRNFSSQERDDFSKIWSEDLFYNAFRLLKSDDTKDTSSPLWKSYAMVPKLRFATSLVTIDILSNFEVFINNDWKKIIEILTYISKFEINGALPSDENSSKRDIGTSAYFAYVCSIRSLRERIRIAPKGETLLDLANRCFKFTIDYSKSLNDEPILSEPISTLLLIKGCPWSTESVNC